MRGGENERGRGEEEWTGEVGERKGTGMVGETKENGKGGCVCG